MLEADKENYNAVEICANFRDIQVKKHQWYAAPRRLKQPQEGNGDNRNRETGTRCAREWNHASWHFRFWAFILVSSICCFGFVAVAKSRLLMRTISVPFWRRNHSSSQSLCQVGAVPWTGRGKPICCVGSTSSCETKRVIWILAQAGLS